MDHILQALRLPDRFEALSVRLGAELGQVLVPPTSDAHLALERASFAIRTRGEGLFVPMYARPGAGKTTFASSLVYFFPAAYRPTVSHDGAVTFDALRHTALDALRDSPANDDRILPILLDHRERNPASDEELGAIKRFLRSAGVGAQPILLWPETNEELANSMSERYVAIAGQSPISLPLRFAGPDREMWVDVAINTLKIANSVNNLEELGVDPRGYDPAKDHTLGDFLRRISTDFDNLRFKLLKETQKPITLLFVFCSETQDPGVLTQLTTASRYGAADAHALVAVTPTSELGKWWSIRRALLTRAMIQLNVQLFSMPPGASMGVQRRYGSEDAKRVLDSVGLRAPGKSRLVRDLARTDLGKYLKGETIRAYEARGTPAKVSLEGFKKLAEAGFTSSRDKVLNKAFRDAWVEFFNDVSLPHREINAEKSLGFVPLIPDTAIQQDTGAVCIEYHWRSGDFLRPSNRSDVAGYVLRKTRDYVRQLGWTRD